MKYLLSTWLIFGICFAQWSSDPAAPQLLGSGIQAQVAATSDNGVYIAWLTNGTFHVYLQRFDSLGIKQLGDNGLLVSNNVNSSWIAFFHLNLVVDDEDNAIITTVDQRTGTWEVYAYKIAPDGTMLWGSDGLSLSDSGVDNIAPRLTVLDDNSVVVTWVENYAAIKFQCISSDGTFLWGDGIYLDEPGATLTMPLPITTTDGHVLIQWIRQTGPSWSATSTLTLQKYDLNGISVWGDSTIVVGSVSFPTGNWLQQSAAESDGGSYSAWTELSGNVQRALAQHITSDGDLSWTGSVELSTNTNMFRISPMVAVAETSQELMAAWKQSNSAQSQRGIYAQRLDANGSRLWGTNGIEVVALNSNYDYLDLSTASFDESMIAVYIRQSNNSIGDVYAHRLGENGNSEWTNGAVQITNSGGSKSDLMIGKGSGCVFIAWTKDGNVYTHCLREDGTLGAPITEEETDHVLEVPLEYATIQEALNSALTGDTVLVAPGTYFENLIWPSVNGIKLIGSNQMTSIIDGDSISSVIRFDEELGGIIDSNTIISGFKIQNGYPHGSLSNRGGGIYLYSSSPKVTDLIITNNSAQWGGGICCYNSSNPYLTNIVIFNNYGLGGGIYLYSSNPIIIDATISNNSAMNNPGGGISCYYSNPTLINVLISGNTATSGGGIDCLDSDPTLINVTISGNTASSGGGIYCYNNSSPTLLNTILWNDLPNEIYLTGGSANVTYSNIQGGWAGAGNIDADPLFCAPDTGNFYLAENSPCVGSGENGGNMGAWGVGCPALEILFDDNELPVNFTLHQNYPNPFNPVTTIKYDLPEQTHVNIMVYDIMGREVRSLVSQTQDAGFKSVIWNGTNEAGSPVSAGMYLYQIKTSSGFIQTKKLVLLK